MNSLLATLAATGTIGGSAVLFWLVVILIILAIIYFVRRF